MNFSDSSLDLEVGVRNKRTSRTVESRSRKTHRTAKSGPVRVIFLARAGRVLKNKKPSRIPGKIVSERLETTTELLKAEANPELWYDLQGDSDGSSEWGTACGTYPNDDSEFDRDEELLDLMWEEQLGRHLERGERFSEERPAFYDSDSSNEDQFIVFMCTPRHSSESDSESSDSSIDIHMPGDSRWW